jgi:hypothetical protein
MRYKENEARKYSSQRLLSLKLFSTFEEQAKVKQRIVLKQRILAWKLIHIKLRIDYC